jgi:hypothetical protein
MTGLIVAFAFLMLLALWFFPPLFAAGMIAVAVLGGIRAERPHSKGKPYEWRSPISACLPSALTTG